MLKPWLDGDQVWVGWSQSVKLNVTRDLLIKMNLHKITCRVWDSKDRISIRAKYDRPAAFRPLDRRSTEALDETGRFAVPKMNIHLGSPRMIIYPVSFSKQDFLSVL